METLCVQLSCLSNCFELELAWLSMESYTGDSCVEEWFLYWSSQKMKNGNNTLGNYFGLY